MLDEADFSNTEYMIRRGWRKWSDEELFEDPQDQKRKVLLLCPLSDFPNVADGTRMCSITGEFVVKGTDYIDDDTRGGVMAFGVLVESVVIPDLKKKYRSIDDPPEPNPKKTV